MPIVDGLRGWVPCGCSCRFDSTTAQSLGRGRRRRCADHRRSGFVRGGAQDASAAGRCDATTDFAVTDGGRERFPWCLPSPCRPFPDRGLQFRTRLGQGSRSCRGIAMAGEHDREWLYSELTAGLGHGARLVACRNGDMRRRRAGYLRARARGQHLGIHGQRASGESTPVSGSPSAPPGGTSTAKIPARWAWWTNSAPGPKNSRGRTASRPIGHSVP